MSVTLTDALKARIRHHLGYVGVAAVQTFVLGVPAPLQPSFIIEGAMNRLLPESVDSVNQLVGQLDSIESQMGGDMELLAITRVDEIEIDPEEHKKLRREYIYWRAALANIFGCEPNPYDQRFAGMGGGINVPVGH